MNQNSNTSILEIIENEPRVSHFVIAEHTGNKEKSVLDLITRNMSDFEEFGNLRFKIVSLERTTKTGKSRGKVESKEYLLNEQQATLLMTYLRNSEPVKIFKKRLVKEFFQMREKLQEKSKSEPKPNLSLQEQVFGLETAIKVLNPSQASKIMMLTTLYKKLGLETSYLPKYSDEDLTYSLSHLLKKFEVGISAKKLNLTLLERGYLEIKTRKSMGSIVDEKTKEKKPKMREFKSLTEKGLKYGKNIVSPQNQRETQPHYFENKFEELLKLISEE